MRVQRQASILSKLAQKDKGTPLVSVATNVSEDWHEVGSGGGEPAFQNSWVNYDATNNETVAFFKDSKGSVHLKGQVDSGTAGTTIFTLPLDYRPAKIAVFASVAINVSTLAPGFIFVSDTGEVAPYLPGNTLVTLDGISFRAAP